MAERAGREVGSQSVGSVMMDVEAEVEDGSSGSGSGREFFAIFWLCFPFFPYNPKKRLVKTVISYMKDRIVKRVKCAYEKALC